MTIRVEDALEFLVSRGFTALPRPLRIVDTEFDFEAAARGSQRSQDLILIASDRISQRRLRRLLSALARSLDAVGSSRPITLLIIGTPEDDVRRDLEALARVLVISEQSSKAELTRAVSVLLPLSLPSSELAHGADPVNEVLAQLGPRTTTAEHIVLIESSADGPDAVRERLRRYVNEGVGWTDTGESDA